MASFRVSRTASMDADPGRVHALVNDFRAWTAWSPWEDLDPNLDRVYAGAETGVGAQYAWSGNRKAGAGSMEILASVPERIDLVVVFMRPFKATNDISFTFTPTSGAAGEGTVVEWAMTGQNSGLRALLGRLIPMDKIVGKDFEKGLARLKETAEA